MPKLAFDRKGIWAVCLRGPPTQLLRNNRSLILWDVTSRPDGGTSRRFARYIFLLRGFCPRIAVPGVPLPSVAQLMTITSIVGIVADVDHDSFFFFATEFPRRVPVNFTALIQYPLSVPS